MAYVDQYNLAMSDEFQHRILIALLNTGRKAMQAPTPVLTIPEGATEEEAAALREQYEQQQKKRNTRIGFSRTLLTEPDRYIRMISLAVATVPNITATTTDTQLQTTIDSLFDLYAGAMDS